MTINFLPTDEANLEPKITVIGLGGAGGNAVDNMINAGLQGVGFVVGNTDVQALGRALAPRKIKLGINVTRGLGAGAKPQIGRAAAEEAIDDIMNEIEGSNMVFIAAGMGGGTGTGAAPVIAQAARERGILTVGVVTKPFHFEGAHRMRLAESGIEELAKYVDTLIVIPNQNLFRMATERTTFADAFRMADEVLHSGVRGVTDLIVMPGLINLDFADIKAVMTEMGKAMMGTGEAEGERRAIEAAERAISNPLLDDASMKGARALLVNVSGGDDMTLFEVDEAVNRIRDEVDPDANVIFGATFSDKLNGKMRISVVATGINQSAAAPKAPVATNTSTPAVSQRPNTPHLFNEPAISMPSVNRPAPAMVAELKPAMTSPTPPTETPAASEPPVRPSIFNPSSYPSMGISRTPITPTPRADVPPSVAAKPLNSGTGASYENMLSRPTSSSLFERATGINRPKTPSAPEASNPPADSKEEDLDIPAFLRRKAQ